ncbi:hemolysin-III related protein [Plasmodiophora brassicae]|uniref:Uncharacterized protein n=2 Tax=Plasmodiophora brassicae TaxID=37360 RepID=A0A3P3XYV2_PLABS|nr:unnamed protein product [Plasmodiophora brassicae]
MKKHGMDGERSPSPRSHTRMFFAADGGIVEVRTSTDTSPTHKQRAESTRKWPPHVAKNRYIARGFSIHEGYWHKLADLHTFDNETMNIISAIVGFAPSALLVLNLASMPSIDGFNPNGLYMSIALFACNALIVAGYHAFLSIPHHYSIWSAGDLIGINLAIMALSLCLQYYGFQLTNLSWQAEFILVVCAIAATSAFCAVYRVMDGRDGLLWLQGVNIICVIIFVIPTHILHTPKTPRGDLFLFLLIAGAVIHVLKIPERLVPHRFDLFGHSHMWWHLAYSIAYYAFFTNMFVIKTGRADLLWDHELIFH